MAILSKTNITTTAVGNALGSGSRDVGTLCTHPNIKMWSRMKPVRISSPAPNRDPRLKWWKGDSGNCGIDLSNALSSSIRKIPSLYTSDKNNGYKYARPNGGASQPYRLADFGGYKTDAVPPVDGFICNEQIDTTSGSTLHAQININQPEIEPTGPGSLSFEEIGGLTINGELSTLHDFYLGIAVCREDNSLYKYKTSSNRGGTDVEIPAQGFSEGTYKVYPFLSSVYLDGRQELVGQYYTVPNVSFRRVEVLSSLARIIIYASWERDPYTNKRKSIYYKIEVQQNIENQMHIRDNWIILRLQGRDENDPFIANEKQKRIGDVTANKNEVTLISEGRFSDIDVNKDYYIIVRLQSNKYHESMDVDDERVDPEM